VKSSHFKKRVNCIKIVKIRRCRGSSHITYNAYKKAKEAQTHTARTLFSTKVTNTFGRGHISSENAAHMCVHTHKEKSQMHPLIYLLHVRSRDHFWFPPRRLIFYKPNKKLEAQPHAAALHKASFLVVVAFQALQR
jgi:hypothetical protein